MHAISPLRVSAGQMSAITKTHRRDGRVGLDLRRPRHNGQSVTASPSDPHVWNTNETELASLFEERAPAPSAPGPSGPIATAIAIPEPSQHDLQNPPPEFYVLLNSIRTGTCSKIERGGAEMLLELVLHEDIIPIRPVNNKVRGHAPCRASSSSGRKRTTSHQRRGGSASRSRLRVASRTRRTTAGTSSTRSPARPGAH